MEIQGWVLEKGRREPVAGAAVFVKALRIGGYTNAKGEFRLKLPKGKHRLSIKSIGFLSGKRTIVVSEPKKKLTLYLLPDPANPLQTTTRARRVKKSSQEFRASRDELAGSPGVIGGDPFRFFQNLPGVARAARTSGALVVRGASFADTGFYIDGHTIPILYHFGAGLTVVNRRFLESVNFYPGGAPLRFGRLTAGLISAHSRDPDATQVHGEVYVSIANAGFYLEIPIGKKWTIAAAASRSYIDAFYSLLTKDPLVGAFWDYQLKVAYTTRRHQFSLFLLGSDDYYDYAGLKDGVEVPLIGREKVTRALRFLRLIAKYRYRYKRFSIRSSLAFGFNQFLTEKPSLKDERWDLPLELRVDAVYRFTRKLRLEFGLDSLWSLQFFDFRLPTSDVAGFPKPDPGAVTFEGQAQKALLAPALYAAINWEILKGLRVRLGLRSDLFVYQGRVHPTLAPRVSASYQLHKSWKLLFAAGLYQRPPSPDQWSSERGNPDLKMPAAGQLAAGVEFRHQRLFFARAQVFFNQMFDLIVPSQEVVQVDGALRDERFNNRGLGRAYGVEILTRFRLWKRLAGWVAYTLSRAERSTSADGPYQLYEFDQTHILNVMLSWRIGAGWRLSARFRLATGNPVPSLKQVTYDADTDNYTPTFQAQLTERLPLFHQLDLRVDKTFVFNTWKLGFYIDILNVYNAKVAEEYRFSYNYQKRTPVQGLPFFPALGIRGEF